MSDLTVEILREIRDELQKTRTELSHRIDATNQRLDSTREELSSRMERLERRQSETEVRLATELIAVAGAVRDLKDAILEDRKLRETVAGHEARIGALERKAG